MTFLRRLALVLGINAVPIAGVVLVNWGSATALASYWFENLAAVLLVGARIAAHRRITRTAGHFRGHINAPKGSRSGMSFLAEYLTTGLVFTLAHGVVLTVFMLATGLKPDLSSLLNGLAIMITLLLVGFAFDMLSLRTKPFAWVKTLALASLGRVVLVHLAIIAGVGLAAVLGRNELFLLPFAALKLLVDVFGLLRLNRDGDADTPAWLIAAVNKLKPGEDFAAYLANERAREASDNADDERVVAARGHNRSTGRRSR